ncbi:DUF6504 family protein [Actinorugispora endophytica]|uniref:DUF6504 domain-containing protein n=1 Tax=Actinorugispora endophytica TaxID=1605990 RepID=A0A4R6USJ6_9ACTN|nr:hypothetical protein EV190_11734 [Actinorugispora endophytica]
MGQVYGVPVQVWDQGGRPARFVWQGRLYVVQQILEHWVTLRSDFTAGRARRPPARTFWRVRVGAGAESGVYELRHDSATDDWLLARVDD